MNEVLSAAADPLAAPLARYLLHGDEAGMEEVVARTRPRLLAAAARIGSPSDADDAVQQAYLSLVRRRGTLLEAPVLPWLLTATIRCAYRRKAIARRESALAERLSQQPRDAGEPAWGREDSGAPDAARVRGAVARLPQRYRDVVVLCDVLGLAPAEAAPLLDLAPATVRVRLHRGRRLVRSRFSPRLVAAWLALPWFLAGRGRDAASGGAALAAGGLVTTTTVAVIGGAAVVAGIAIGRFLLPAPGPQDVRLEAAEAQARDLKAQVARLEDAVRAAKAATLAEAPKPAPAAVPAATPPAPTAPSATAESMGDDAAAGGAPAAKKYPVQFAIPGRKEGLDEVDWKAVGTNMSGMVPLIDDLAGQMAAGKTPSMQSQGRIARLNGALVEAATTVEGKWNTGNVNGAFTHPAFMSNAIAASLAAAGKPLTEGQAQSLGRLGVTYTEEDQRRTAGYSPTTLALQKTIDEADLRDRFFADAFGLLTEEQRSALSPPATRGRMSLDLYSSGLLWATVASPIGFTTKEGLATELERTLLEHQKALASGKDEVHAAVQEWAATLPKEVLEAAPDVLSSMGMPTVAQATGAAKRQLVLYQRLLDGGRLTEEAAKSVRESSFVLIPVKR